MVLAGILIATYFHGLADLIRRNTRMKRLFAMLISTVGTFILVGLLLWFMGTKIQVQVNQLSAGLPHTISNVKAQLSKSEIGQKILDGLNNDDSGKMLSTAQNFFGATFGVLGEMYIILFLGIFFTALALTFTRMVYYYWSRQSKKEMGRHIIDRISMFIKRLAERNVIIYGDGHHINRCRLKHHGYSCGADM